MISRQVFDRADFPIVVTALQAAQAKGDGIISTHTLTTVENTWWGVPAGLKVDITFSLLGKSCAVCVEDVNCLNSYDNCGVKVMTLLSTMVNIGCLGAIHFYLALCQTMLHNSQSHQFLPTRSHPVVGVQIELPHALAGRALGERGGPERGHQLGAVQGLPALLHLWRGDKRRESEPAR